MRLILTTLFSLIHLISHCVPASGYPDADYGINWYTDSDGLPQNSVKQIFRDAYGFIWLLTQNGLVRYDGRNFRVFNSENTSIHNNRMTYAVGNPSADSIFVHNEFDETLLISGRTAKTFYKNPDFRFCIRPCAFTWKNSKPVCYPDKPISIPTSGTAHFSVGNDTVRYHVNGKDNYKLYFAHKDPSRFFTLGDTLYYLENDGRYAAIHNGNIYFSKTKLPDEDLIGIIHNSIARQTFVHTGRNLYLIQKRDRGIYFKCILRDFRFSPENGIHAIYYDPFLEHIYMGSDTRGLAIVKNHEFKSINAPGTSRVQYALTNYGANRALSATGAIIDADSGSGEKMEIPWKSDKYSVIIDHNGDIWTKRDNFLYRYTGETAYRESEQWVLPQKIEQLYKGNDGKIWIALHLNDQKRVASKGALYYIDPSHPNCIPQGYKILDFGVSFMLQTTDSTLWIGSFNGLYELDLTGKKTRRITGLYTKHIKSLYASGPEELWITTSTSGIFLYKNGTLTAFPPDRKGYMLSSHCIVEDDYGYLWITTSKGLFQVSKKKMLDYASGRMKQVYYHYYNKNSGFLSNEFNGSCTPCGIKLDKGYLALPSLNGVVVFDPKRVRPNLPNKTIYIDEVKTGEHTLAVQHDTVVLRRDFGRVHIRLATPYFDNPYNLNMEFKLEGENNKNWEYIEDGQTITFSQLPPGKHTLIIRKMNSFYSHYIHKRITLIVPPYFWETDWFYTLLFLAIPVIIFYSVKLRIKYVRYKNALLKKKIIESTRHLRSTISTLRVTKDKLKQHTDIQEKLIASISHDIRSPLRFMVDTGEYLYANYDTGNKKMIREGIKSMHNASIKIHEFISELLDYSKARIYEGMGNTVRENYKLYDLIEEKIALFKEIAHSQKTEIFNRIPHDFSISVNKHLLSIVIHNLLDNAVKNTHNGNVTLRGYIWERKLHILIEDTGKGIPTGQLRHYQSLINPGSEKNAPYENPNKSLGFKIILDLLIILNGKIDIKSVPNRGTRVTLTFPPDNP